MNSTVNADFGLKDKISNGLRRDVDTMQAVHPIEVSERHFSQNQEKAWCDQMKKVQGLHAPLKMMYERRAVAKVGHFACISTRSNFQMDILTGNDDEISFNDFLGQPEHYEGFAHPHDVIDKSLAPRKN